MESGNSTEKTMAGRVMEELTLFQQKTVERVCDQFENGQNRVLVADEVGLGKTRIAKGVIAQLAEKALKGQSDEEKKPFKVVYITSNASIAAQNLEILKKIDEESVEVEKVVSSKLSMAHLNIHKTQVESKGRSVLLIPLTPRTSVFMRPAGGNVNERALIYAVLEAVLKEEVDEKKLEELSEFLRNGVSSWKPEGSEVSTDKKPGNLVDYYKQEIEAANGIGVKDGVKTYIEHMKYELAEHMEKIRELCKNPPSKEDKENVNTSIKWLRTIFAKISLGMLNPDLVIMDEFQRFKDLIENAEKQNTDKTAEAEQASKDETDEKVSEVSMLAEKFFKPDTKVLLLSATPYKMYSSPYEYDERGNEVEVKNFKEEHNSEFISVINFLRNGKDPEDIKKALGNYLTELEKIKPGAENENAVFIENKSAVENILGKIICRTERVSDEHCVDLIDTEGVRESVLKPETADIIAYLQACDLLSEDNVNYKVKDLINFTKSSPYLLSFMSKSYEMKKKVMEHFKTKGAKVLEADKFSHLLISRDTIKKYEKIPANNARLNMITDVIFGKDKNATGIEKLLWLPPTLPYYKSEGVYENKKNMSKILIFSRYKMVPKMLSAMLSYEAERRIMCELLRKGKRDYFDGRDGMSEAEIKRAQSRSDNIVKNRSGATIKHLAYPSEFLTGCYVPAEHMGETIDEIKKYIISKIEARLDKCIAAADNKKEDPNWYYIAPLLLDDLDDRNMVEEFFSDIKNDPKEQGSQKELFSQIESMYVKVRDGEPVLGKIPKNLYNKLAEMAIASPAVCFNRLLCKGKEALSKEEKREIRAQARKLAVAFIKRMSNKEAASVVAVALSIKSATKPNSYWHWFLQYCMNGNLQAVLDEYAHLLANGDKSVYSSLEKAFKIKIRSTREVETFKSFKETIESSSKEQANPKDKDKRELIRTYFASGINDDSKNSEKDDAEGDIVDNLRTAFNSPFWPFVLSSTSIGQEGLDFHYYCRRIVHWNLPANPVDLEQREGRINRFKNLAIRQNIVQRYYNGSDAGTDIWEQLFKTAEGEENKKIAENERSGLIPNWGLTEQDDPEMIKIERIVPMYPLSADEMSYRRMIWILTVYRLTLGQVAQEELAQTLLGKGFGKSREVRDLCINLSPFFSKVDKTTDETDSGT